MTDRNLTAGMAAAVQERVVRVAILFSGVFDGGTLRLWSGVGDLVWDGNTYTGGGSLLGVSPIDESTQIEALGFAVTLSGMPSDLVAIALAGVRQGKPGRLWLACFDEAQQLIDEPYLLQAGKFDIAIIEDDGERCTITAQYESRLIDLLKPRDRRYTPQDQRRDYPTDRGFDQVTALQDKLLIWGGPSSAASTLATPADDPGGRNGGGDSDGGSGGGDGGGGGGGGGGGDGEG